MNLFKEDVETLYTEGELQVLSKDKELVKIKVRSHCSVCDDSGALIVWNPNTDKFEIIRCRECNKYDSDEEAWAHLKPEEPDETEPEGTKTIEDLTDEEFEELDAYLKDEEGKL